MDLSSGSDASHMGPVREIHTEPLSAADRIMLIAHVAAPLAVLIVMSVVAVLIPPLRTMAGAWVVGVVGLLAFGLPRVRKIFRGERERSSLILDGCQLRYLDSRGTQLACPRAAIRSATLLVINSKKRTSNLIVFRDDQGVPLMSIPSGVLSRGAVHTLLADLGIGSLHHTFLTSEAELDALAPGLQPSGFCASSNTLFDDVPRTVDRVPRLRGKRRQS
jgi:hypothetical protein